MYELVSQLSDLHKNDLRVVTPHLYDDKHIFNIFYKHHKPFLIQTPICTLPYGYSLYDDKYVHLDLICNDSKFKILLDNLLSIVLEKIRKKYLAALENKVQIFSTLEHRNNFRFRVRNYDYNSVYLFDIDKKRIAFTELERHDQVRCIFQVDKLVIDAKRISLNFKVIQLKKYGVYIDKSICMFNDISDNTTADTTKYQKMLKMGVPLLAVKQKMTVEGIAQNDISLFERLYGKEVPKHKVPPPPPPPPPIFTLKQSKTQPPTLAFLADIKSCNFQLKKIVNSQPNIKDSILRGVDKSKKVPSLQDILNAKAKLKKTDNTIITLH